MTQSAFGESIRNQQSGTSSGAELFYYRIDGGRDFRRASGERSGATGSASDCVADKVSPTLTCAAPRCGDHKAINSA